jgi:hypothetical protein
MPVAWELDFAAGPDRIPVIENDRKRLDKYNAMQQYTK